MTHWKANNEQSKIFLEQSHFWRFTIDLRGRKWLHWSTCSILDKSKRLSVWNKPTWQEQKNLRVIYLRAQVNFRQLPAETTGNRYLRRLSPATAVIFTLGSVYLRPSLVNLHASVLQYNVWTSEQKPWRFKATIANDLYIDDVHSS